MLLSPRLCSVFSSVQRFLETGDMSWRPEYKVSSELQQLLFSFLSHSSSRARSFNWTFFPRSQDSASSCLDTLQHCMQMTHAALLLYPAVHLLIYAVHQFTHGPCMIYVACVMSADAFGNPGWRQDTNLRRRAENMEFFCSV